MRENTHHSHRRRPQYTCRRVAPVAAAFAIAYTPRVSTTSTSDYTSVPPSPSPPTPHPLFSPNSPPSSLQTSPQPHSRLLPHPLPSLFASASPSLHPLLLLPLPLPLRVGPQPVRLRFHFRFHFASAATVAAPRRALPPSFCASLGGVGTGGGGGRAELRVTSAQSRRLNYFQAFMR
ncbi:hypothetical protein R5R35_001496 [Gryllus longicercus]|uniref:Uncharacterized protein n=1 Tax=Gryllus longicercus TaxID=2509291 RepID=A0AAN9W7S7_9ORTH